MIVPLENIHISETAKLNVSLDPTSLFAKIGKDFREKVFYKEIVEQENNFGFVYTDNNKVVGYISCTLDSSVFYERIKSKYTLILFSLMLRLFLRFPLTAVRYMELFFNLEQGCFDTQARAEIISFGVLPEYRSLEYFKRTGIKIPVMLFMKALEKLNEKGIAQVKFTVAADNALANIFFLNFGSIPVKKFKFLGSRQTMYSLGVLEALRRKEGNKNGAI